MNVEQARETIKNTVAEAAALCKEKGFIASAKTYYTDKTLRECANFSENAILVFGAVKFGLDGMDDEDFCTYGLCVETRLGMVKEEELEKEIANFKESITSLIEEISKAPSPTDKIREINLRQEEEAEAVCRLQHRRYRIQYQHRRNQQNRNKLRGRKKGYDCFPRPRACAV